MKCCPVILVSAYSTVSLCPNLDRYCNLQPLAFKLFPGFHLFLLEGGLGIGVGDMWCRKWNPGHFRAKRELYPIVFSPVLQTMKETEKRFMVLPSLNEVHIHLIVSCSVPTW